MSLGLICVVVGLFALGIGGYSEVESNFRILSVFGVVVFFIGLTVVAVNA